MRLVYAILILLASAGTAYFVGADQGYNVGFQGGYSQAILDGQVEVTCNFPCKEGRARE